MGTVRDQILSHTQSLRLTYLKKNVESTIHQAQTDKPTYQQYTLELLEQEVKQRRLKMAGLSGPYNLEQNYNIVFMGLSGTGKTFMASRLIYEAIKQGYKAYFLTMEELVQIIRLKEVTSSALGKYNRLLKSHLIAIDDIMMFPMKKHESVALFNLIDYLHEKSSVIITTNKSPKQWAEALDDEVLSTALLDRILYRCEVIKLTGQSYRMENRKTIFDDKKKND